MLDRVQLDVASESLDHLRRSGHGPDARQCLRRTELHSFARCLNELAVDGDGPPQEVDPVDGETQHLASPQAHACSEAHHGASAFQHVLPHCDNLFDRQRHDLSGVLSRELDADARTRGNESICDGRPEDGGEQAIVPLRVRFCTCAISKIS